MMPKRSIPSLVRAASALALALVIAGCTKGGQFDPTEILNSDTFDSKKKLTGQREPLFPGGVPGASTGVPPDLVKGYQAPPEQAADTSAAVAPPPAAKPKPKPKPKLASAPAAPPPPRTRIDLSARPAAATPPPAGSSDSVWPTAQPTAPPAQSAWPAPPPTTPPQQTAQPAQSIWPNPPAAGTTPR
jgi:hypothetical protein